MKVVAFAPTFTSAEKFVQVAPTHLAIQKPVSFEELSCHWSLREFNETAVTVKLLGGFGAVAPLPADFATSIVAN
jgi:hypothetical protein